MIARPRQPLHFLAEAWLLGTASLAFLLLALSVLRIAWSQTIVVAAAIVVLIAIVFLARRAAPFAWPQFEIANVLDAVTLLLIIGYIRLTALAPPADADFFSIWGVKAKQFFMLGGIDWHFLQDPVNVPLHVDYPILVPLLYDVQALLAGHWLDERWLTVMHAGASISALVLVRAFLADDLSHIARAAATLIVMPLVFSPYFGLAETFVVAYGTVGLFYIRRAVRDDSISDTMLGAVYLGLTASSKNEGLTLIVAAVLAVVCTRRRLFLYLWPSAAVILPWLTLRWWFHLVSDLANAMFSERLREHLRDPMAMLRVFANNPWGPTLFWIGIAAALILGARHLLREERFLTIALFLQLLFFIGAYLVTPYDIAWHVRWSGERILRQIVPSIALLALLVTVIRFRAENANAPDS